MDEVECVFVVVGFGVGVLQFGGGFYCDEGDDVVWDFDVEFGVVDQQLIEVFVVDEFYCDVVDVVDLIQVEDLFYVYV